MLTDACWLLLVLLALPVVAAVTVALLGPRRLDAIRWVSLGTTLACLALAAAASVGFAQLRRLSEKPATTVLTFQPEFVPGDPGKRDADGKLLKDSEGNPLKTHGTTWNLLVLGRADSDRPAAIQFYIGLDGLNVWLMLLTAVLLVSAVLVSWNAIQERVNEYYAWLLLLETAMIGVFLSFDIVLFYVFFELTLVPLFFLIGIWGGPERRYAARKFFIYTLTGSLITLLGVFAIILACQSRSGELTFSIPRLVEIEQKRLALDSDEERRFWRAAPALSLEKLREWAWGTLPREEAADMWGGVEFWVFLALMAGFAIKVPLVPLHTWLPLAHVEAPTAGSVLLAGVLLKIGAYGFLRLCLPLVPDASLSLGVPLIGTVATLGIIYGALCALAQDDIKKLVAYSSVSHLGMCMLGMFALNVVGLSGSLLQMVNHGLSTGALFLLVGMLYERYHTRKLSDYGGMGARLKLLACFMVFICLTSIGLPFLNGFWGELLVLMGAFNLQAVQVDGWLVGALLGVVLGIGIIMAAGYMGALLQREFSGSLLVFAIPILIGLGGSILVWLVWELFAGQELPLGPVLGFAGASGIVLGAWYLLTMLQRVFFGPVKEPDHEGHGPVGDLAWRELAALVPIALLCVAIGVYPQGVQNAAQRDLEVVAGIAEKAKDFHQREAAANGSATGTAPDPTGPEMVENARAEGTP
jgi:NADH-quinone oxidoreductase subunit M